MPNSRRPDEEDATIFREDNWPIGMLPDGTLNEVEDDDDPPEEYEKEFTGLVEDRGEPKSLYVCRELVNTKEFKAWAEAQGFDSIIDDLHVTVLYSKKPVDWFEMGEPYAEQVEVKAGGPRSVEPLGDEGAMVLHFASSELCWRHEEMVRKGASHDYDDYQCHVTITYKANVNAEDVEPYRGRLVFGPEIFKEIDGPYVPPES